ncbi:MAG: HDIG domain-containing protein [Patescibacteria group bacterium]|nr:HDIG domain-containing protein [Patescibacteria group bacterium]
MTRDEALKLLNEKLENKNLIKHSLAVEVVMRALAKHFGEDAEVWGMAGLLHDLDYEETADDWKKHGVLVEEWLKDSNLPKEVFDIIKAHNSDILNISRNTLAEKAIFAVDPLTGLITAASYVMPDKKISLLKPKSVLKRFKTPAFAKGSNREYIQTCDDFGLTLEEFVDIALKAMQSIDKDLGL